MLSRKLAESSFLRVINTNILYDRLPNTSIRNRIVNRSFTRWIVKNSSNKPTVDNQTYQIDWSAVFKRRLLRLIRKFIQYIGSFIRKITINTISLVTSFMIVKYIVPSLSIFNHFDLPHPVMPKDLYDYLEESISNLEKNLFLIKYSSYFAYGYGLFISALVAVFYYNY